MTRSKAVQLDETFFTKICAEGQSLWQKHSAASHQPSTRTRHQSMDQGQDSLLDIDL